MRKSLTMLLAGVALAGLAGSAGAQVPYGAPYGGYGNYGAGAPTATLYELPGFMGRSIVVTAENSNLDGVGFNDRARSARFEGTWNVCADADYRGHCEPLSGSVTFLPSGLNASASSLRVAGDYDSGWNGGWNPGTTPGWGGGADTAILYEYPNFQGRSVVINRENANLDGIGFNDRARSIRLEGSWNACEDAGYRGRCLTLNGAVPDLARAGINGLSSLQMSGGGYPGYPGGTGQGVPGRSVVFYPGVVTAGGVGTYGGYNRSGASRTSADAFCRQMGSSSSVYYDSSGGVLSDVLCRR